MKLITVALVCLLVAGMWLQDVSSMSLQVPSSICCFKFMRKKIHKKRITCYKDTSSFCPHQRGVILSLRKGKEHCALKGDQWVDDLLDKLQPCKTKEM